MMWLPLTKQKARIFTLLHFSLAPQDSHTIGNRQNHPERQDDVALDALQRLDQGGDAAARRLDDGGALTDALRAVVVEGGGGDAELVVEAFRLLVGPDAQHARVLQSLGREQGGEEWR